jgi:hypothetical protein
MCQQVEAAPAATFVSGPRTGAPARPRRVAPERSQDELLDELIASLQAEAALAPGEAAARPETVKAVLQEIGFGQSSHELAWAIWGFSVGFLANVAVAKYAQMSSGAGMAEFIPAFLIGGIVAGAACAGIGWGLAKLRDKPQPARRW